MNEMSEMSLDDVAVLLIQKECSEEDSDDLFRFLAHDLIKFSY